MFDESLGAAGAGCYGMAMLLVAIPMIIFSVAILGNIIISLFSIIFSWVGV